MNQVLPAEFLKTFRNQGFALSPYRLDDITIATLLQTVQTSLQTTAVKRHQSQLFAIRNLLDVCPELTSFLNSDFIRAHVTPMLGENVWVTRAIFFDKQPKTNWKVSWHQDVTITVKEQKETSGFSNWSNKAGVTHVQPPLDILQGILTLRLHLDDSNESNGALKVIPGTHRLGRLNDIEIRSLIENKASTLCKAQRGELLLLSPLLLHASSPGTAPHHRRIIHIEYSATPLPNGLAWRGT